MTIKVNHLSQTFWKRIYQSLFHHKGCIRLQNSRLFFSKSVKKSVKRGVKVIRAPSARASYAPRACEARGKKSLPSTSLALCFQPRTFVIFCLTSRAYSEYVKYTDCFADKDWMKQTKENNIYVYSSFK